MELFIVFQEAIYRHGLVGIFDDRSKAIEASIEAAKNDIDDHHYYVIYPATLNEVALMVPSSPGLDNEENLSPRYPREEKPVYIANKKDLEKNFLDDEKTRRFLSLPKL